MATFIGCSNNPLSSSNEPSVGSTDFHISGKITNNDGSPIKGAVARLTKSGLSVTTDANGNYTITGKASTRGLKKVALAKSAALLNEENTDSYSDTLSVKVANPVNPNDSSEVVKTVVTSGVVMDLPTTYIIQREIRGYLTAEDEAVVGKIEACVYDNTVPDQVKVIDLWHDITNKAFSSFAYFTSETNKSYTIYVKIYDNQNKFIGRSPDFKFPDNAGNIVYKDPFAITNAKPILIVEGPDSAIITTDAIVNITAVDSFGGSITKCEIAVGNNSYSDIGTFKASLAKRSTFGNVFNETINLPVSDKDSIIIASVKVTDNDGNITTKEYTLKVKQPKLIAGMEWNYKNVFETGLKFNKISDTVTLKLKEISCDLPSYSISKIEWQIMNEPMSVKMTDSTIAWISGNVNANGEVTVPLNMNANDNGSETVPYPITYDSREMYKINFYMIYAKVTLTNGYTKTFKQSMSVVMADLGKAN
jgi:hypothetical protein